MKLFKHIFTKAFQLAFKDLNAFGSKQYGPEKNYVQFSNGEVVQFSDGSFIEW